MSELLSNRGFEAGDDGSWTFTGDGSPGILETSGEDPPNARTGSWYASIYALYQEVFEPFETRNGIFQEVSVTPGVAVTAQLFIKLSTGNGAGSSGVSVLVRLTSGASILDHQTVFANTLSESAWLQVDLSGVPPNNTARISAQAYTDAQPGSSDFFVLDDASLFQEGEDVAIIKDLKNKLVLDLTGLTVRSGVTIQDIFTTPRELQDIERFPCVFIIPGGANATADVETLGSRTGLSTQEYLLQYVDRTEDPFDDVADATDAIRNAVEVSGGNLLNREGVFDVVVSDWEPAVPVDEQVAQNVYFHQLTVTVRYAYTRGSA